MAELTDDTHAGTILEALDRLNRYGVTMEARGALGVLVTELDHARAALRRAREDFIMVRDEMEVSTQEAFVDAAITRIDAVLTENAYPSG